MVTHYSTNGLDSACGRSSQTLVSTATAEGVSCKTCLRSLAKPEAASGANKTPSLAELRKSAKATKSAAEVAVPAFAKPAAAPAKAVSKPARSGGFSVKATWAARLAEQSDRCRLPRGKAKQSHV